MKYKQIFKQINQDFHFLRDPAQTKQTTYILVSLQFTQCNVKSVEKSDEYLVKF